MSESYSICIPDFQSFDLLLIFACLIGLVIEEITEEVETVSSGNRKSSSMKHAVAHPQENGDCTKSQSAGNRGGIMTNSESLQALKDDPDTIRFVCVHKIVIACLSNYSFMLNILPACDHRIISISFSFGVFGDVFVLIFYVDFCGYQVAEPFFWEEGEGVFSFWPPNFKSYHLGPISLFSCQMGPSV
jgi:hypothetical protein